MQDYAIFGVERLEDRLLLAVNVTQSGATLNITGDGNDEHIEVHNDGGGIVVVVDEDNDGTAEDYLYYYGVRNISIKTNGGNDEVFISDLDIDGNLTIDTGAGEDFARIDAQAYNFGSYYGAISVGGNVTIKTGDDYDEVWVGETYIDKNLTINTGTDDDGAEILLFGGFFGDYDLDVYGSTKITTGAGDDLVSIGAYDGYDVTFHKQLKIDLGGGDSDEVDIDAYDDGEMDFFGNVEITGGSGDDVINIYVYDTSELTFHKQLKVDLGGGGAYDKLDFSAYDDGEIDLFGKVDIRGASDLLHITVENNGAGDITFHGQVKIDLQQGGDSYVHIHADGSGDIEFDGKVQFQGDDGDDHVDIYAQNGDIVFDDKVHLDGRAGDNELSLDEDAGDIVFNGNLKVTNFVYI
jgi:hypothetical protein